MTRTKDIYGFTDLFEKDPKLANFEFVHKRTCFQFYFIPGLVIIGQAES